MILTRVETGDDRSFVLSFCASCHAIEVHVISTKMFSLVSVRKACRLIPAFLFLIFVAASSRTATGGSVLSGTACLVLVLVGPVLLELAKYACQTRRTLLQRRRPIFDAFLCHPFP